jgi:hypothetical protein
MYLVRISFTNRFGSPFSWDFEVESDDQEEAISEAVLIFWSGLTRKERWDALHDLHVIAHPRWLPPPCKTCGANTDQAPDG